MISAENLGMLTLCEQKARELVLETEGIEETRALAEDYAEKAIAALKDFPESEAKDGLVEMAVKTIKRRK